MNESLVPFGPTTCSDDINDDDMLRVSEDMFGSVLSSTICFFTRTKASTPMIDAFVTKMADDHCSVFFFRPPKYDKILHGGVS